MMALVALVAGILIFLLLLVFSLYLLFAEHLRGHSDTNRVTLEMAKILNESDRSGKINNIVARNRELIALSRENLDLAKSTNQDDWGPLANRLCDEARASQTLVENERKQQIALVKRDVLDYIEQFNRKTKDIKALELPLWKSQHGDILEATLGSVKDVTSNVENTDVYPILRDHDRRQNYFHPDSSLYLGNIDAKLPAPDNDLDFKLSSVAAPVETTISPGRLVDGNVFVPMSAIYADRKKVDKPLDQLPSAIHVVRRSDVTIVTGDKQSMKETSVATCNGAQPLSEEMESQ